MRGGQMEERDMVRSLPFVTRKAKARTYILRRPARTQLTRR